MNLFVKPKKFKDVSKQVTSWQKENVILSEEQLNEAYFYPLTFKERMIEYHKAFKEKVKPKYLVYPTIGIFLLSISATATYFGFNASKNNKVENVVSDSTVTTNMFDESNNKLLVHKKLDSIDEIEILRETTNWSQPDEDKMIKFNKEMINSSIIHILNRAIRTYFSYDPYIAFKYKLTSYDVLIGEVRWSRIEKTKIKGNIYYDQIKIWL